MNGRPAKDRSISPFYLTPTQGAILLLSQIHWTTNIRIKYIFMLCSILWLCCIMLAYSTIPWRVTFSHLQRNSLLSQSNFYLLISYHFLCITELIR